MKKIPTLFQRDPDNMSKVLPEVNLAAEWVLSGPAIATRKFDGTCIMLDPEGQWWARREVKPGKTPPVDYRAEETDANTGKTVGWEPIGQSSFVKAWHDALGYVGPVELEPGTYELCGPKVNGNPEGFDRHTLIRHGCELIEEFPTDFDGIAELMRSGFPFEGVVWHHPLDGRMAKIKRRDFAPRRASP